MSELPRVVEDLRRATNPLFNANKLKLGVLGPNVSGGCAVSDAEGVLVTSWPNTREIVTIADRSGFEVVVPVGRWKGFGGRTNFNGSNFETYTWAAGLGGCTNHTALMATSHIQTIHPVIAAKQATTIDHISGGRFGLNVVCGWYEPEYRMFGMNMMDHDERYTYAQEWLDIVKLLWTREDEFDYEGKYLQVRGGAHLPKPIQAPFPAIMNAGGSEVGRHFAARNADMAFVAILEQDHEGARRQINAFRELAWTGYRRALGIWANAYCVVRPTEQEARELLHHYAVVHGDDEGADNIARVLGLHSGAIPKEMLERFMLHIKAGWCGYPLVGTPDQVAEEIIKLSAAGVDGLIMSWPYFAHDMRYFVETVVPRLEAAGLRRPYSHPA